MVVLAHLPGLLWVGVEQLRDNALNVVDQGLGDGPHYRVYERAGPKAFEDIWRVYPALRDHWPKKPD